jgi:hypothetical protein
MTPRGVENDPWRPRRLARRRLTPPGASIFDESRIEAVKEMRRFAAQEPGCAKTVKF